MNRTQKIVIDSLKKAYDEGQNIFRRPSMQTAFGVINAQAAELTAAQARITALETALQEIVDECPTPTLPYGKSIVSIANRALQEKP